MSVAEPWLSIGKVIGRSMLRGSGYSTLLKAGWNRKRLGNANIGAALSYSVRALKPKSCALAMYGLVSLISTKIPRHLSPLFALNVGEFSGRSLTSGKESQEQTSAIWMFSGPLLPRCLYR